MQKFTYYLTLALVFIIPWEGALQIPGLGNIAKVMGFGVGAFWLLSVIVTKKMRRPGLYHLLVGFFVCWNALSIIWSANPSRTMSQVVTWVQLLLLAFILWDQCNTREKLLTGLQMYVLGSYVAIGSAISNYFAGDPYYTNYERFSPGDMHPDGFGFILALSIPVAWYLASAHWETKWSGLIRFINHAYIPVAFLGLALSGTRAALIASIPGMAFGLISLNRIQIWKRAVIFLLLVVAIFLMLPHVQALKSFQRFGTISSEITEGDLNSRTHIWQEGLETFADHPFAGVGSNMFRTVNSLGKVAHNTYISVLVELGSVGFVLFGLILAITFVNSIGQPRWDAGFWVTILLVWAIGAMTLTWEDKKTTWLFFSLAVSGHAIFRQRIEKAAAIGNKYFHSNFREPAKQEELPNLPVKPKQALG